MHSSAPIIIYLNSSGYGRGKKLRSPFAPSENNLLEDDFYILH